MSQEQSLSGLNFVYLRQLPSAARAYPSETRRISGRDYSSSHIFMFWTRQLSAVAEKPFCLHATRRHPRCFQVGNRAKSLQIRTICSRGLSCRPQTVSGQTRRSGGGTECRTGTIWYRSKSTEASALDGTIPLVTTTATESSYGLLAPHFRYIADELSAISGVPAPNILVKLQTHSSQDSFDTVLPVAALTVNGLPGNESHASEWAAKFSESDILEKPIADGKSLKFLFKPVPLANLVLPHILSTKAAYGTSNIPGLRDTQDSSKGRKRALIEFSSPNIAKPFHAGHLRSTIIGGFLANIYEAMGWEVIRMNFLGDWGRQFGLLAIAFDRYGDEGNLAQDPIGHLFDIYVKINQLAEAEEKVVTTMKLEIEQYHAAGTDASVLEMKLASFVASTANEEARCFFKKMEKGDTDALATWMRFRDLSIVKYEQTYQRLNIKYDFFSGESQVDQSRVEAVVKKLAGSSLCEDAKGALLVNFESLPGGKSLGKAIVRKANGSTMYLTRDVGAALQRFEALKFDSMIYVVASQQDRHMAQMLTLLELIGRGDIAEKSSHVSFGLVRGMSTRKGTVKFLDDILLDAREYMHEVMRGNPEKYPELEDPERTAEIMGVTAVMVQDMKAKIKNDYDFSMERMTALEGNTGPYLQYAHARLCSIMRKADLPADQLLAADLSLLTEAQAGNVIRILARWPTVMHTAFITKEPAAILNYIFKLMNASKWCYKELRVLDTEPSIKASRLALFESIRQVLNNGLRLLGLTPLDRV